MSRSWCEITGEHHLEFDVVIEWPSIRTIRYCRRCDYYEARTHDVERYHLDGMGEEE